VIHGTSANLAVLQAAQEVYCLVCPVEGSDLRRDAYDYRRRSRGEADLVESRVREALFRGQEPFSKKEAKARLKLVDAEAAYYQSPRFLAACPRNQGNTRNQIQTLITHLGQKTLSQVSKTEILAFYTQIKSRGEGLSNRTVHKYHFAYCLFGDFVAELSGEDKNPFRAIKIYQYFKKEASTRDINFLTPGELEAVLSELKRGDELFWRIALFLSHTGMRRSEAYRLKWKDVDFEMGFVTIRLSKNKRSRMIPLEPRAAEAIRPLKDRAEFVFSREDGSRFHIDSILTVLQKAAKAAGVQKRVDVHTLRHSYGSHKIRAGWGIRKVSQILGHSDIQLTASYYSHLLDGDLKVRDEFIQNKSSDLTQATQAIVQSLIQKTDTDLISQTIARQVLEHLKGTPMNFVADLSQKNKTADPQNGSHANGLNSHLLLESYEGNLEPMTGLEPVTYALRKRCSTN
jgi:integrase